MKKILGLAELSVRQMDEAVAVMIEGLYPTIKGFSKDKEVLFRLFRPAIDVNMGYACVENGEVLGILGLADCQKRMACLASEANFTEVLGKQGKFVYRAFEKYLCKVKLTSPDEMEIDVLVTKANTRGQGIGTALVGHALKEHAEKTFYIETWVKNTGAMKLYHRLGFKDIRVYGSLYQRLTFGKMVRMERNHG